MVVIVTDRRQARAPLPEVVAAAVAGGARGVLLREKDLPRPERAELAARLREVLAPAGGRLVVAGPDPLGGDAVHLSVTDPLQAGVPLVGRSCHDAAELDRLTDEDYVTVSPVFPSASKPGYGPPLGPAGLAALCRRTDRPVIALGGIETPAQVAVCVAAGATGVAVMGAVMRADPAEVQEAVAAMATAAARTSATPPVVLTIAGSDSGGGAGIQADLKTFAAQRCYGASVVTAVTAQNTRGVSGVHQLPPEAVASQLDAVLEDAPVAAVKTGMLGSVEVAELVADRARAGALPQLVVDPVLVSSTGHRLGAVAAVAKLLPYAVVATPNLAEASALVGRAVSTPDEMLTAARELAAVGPRCVVVTGGDLPGDEAVDAMWVGGAGELLPAPRVDTENSHGSGCTFSAAIAAQLGHGLPVPDAVERAKSYVARALAGAAGWRVGGGIGPLDHFEWSYASKEDVR